jgi:APA family basic amino acid/polyamine antiporter
MSELRRDLTLFDSISLVIGTIIGSGIFLVPAEIARAVHTPGWMLAIWVIGGVLTMLGALSLAELGAAMPEAGASTPSSDAPSARCSGSCAAG